MDIKFRLLKVTCFEGKRGMFSAPIGQITGITQGRFPGAGQINLASGGTVATVETYEELVSMWEELTEVP